MLGYILKRWSDSMLLRVGYDEIIYLFLLFADHGIDIQNTFKYTYIILEGTFEIKYTYPHHGLLQV